MKKFIYRICVIVALIIAAMPMTLLVSAIAQDVAKNTPPKAPTKAEDHKPAPVILDKTKLLELTNLQLALENAQLKAQAAVPAELKKAISDGADAVAKFWQSVGIKPEELNTKWKADQGPDGVVILTPVEAVKKEATIPAPPK